jgi:hypothetical protein
MQFYLKAELTPKFKVNEIYSDWIERDWFIFQEAVFDLGQEMLEYIHKLITDKSRRDGKTGRLNSSIKLYPQHGMASVGWGIGRISEMNSIAKYWYILNFGGMSWAGLTGQAVPGKFGGHVPDGNMAGTGVGNEHFDYTPYTSMAHGKEELSFMHVKNPIKGMNYIQESQMQLDRELSIILNSIKKGI